MINQAAVRDAPDGRGRRAQIVDAALHVMAEHGFRGASIKRIAQHAGLKSPALIYWYFKDKEALSRPCSKRWPRSWASSPTPSTCWMSHPRSSCHNSPTGSWKTVQQPVIGRFVRVLLSEAARHPSVAAFFAQRGPLVVVNFLERYLARQIEMGRLRAHDPRAGARAFMGMLVVYVLGREVFPAIGASFPRRGPNFRRERSSPETIVTDDAVGEEPCGGRGATA